MSGRRGSARFDPVLHRGLGDLGIGADLERDRHRQAAVGGCRRVEVQQVLDAVDLLLERRRHRLEMTRGLAPGVTARARRSAAARPRVAGDRQLDDRQHAEQEDEDRDDAGKARPVDEKARDVHGRSPLRPCRRASCPRPFWPALPCRRPASLRRPSHRRPARCRRHLAIDGGAGIGMPLSSTFRTCGVTGTPGITRCSPSTTTFSPAFTLPCTTRMPSISAPGLTSRNCGWPFAPTT